MLIIVYLENEISYSSLPDILYIEYIMQVFNLEGNMFWKTAMKCFFIIICNRARIYLETASC